MFVHGGPAGSTSIQNTIFFNPVLYRVILFDQRGAGQSLPTGDIRENTSRHLVSDMEALRTHFKIRRWHVFGASWGCMLSVLYAQSHPEAVASLTIRGVPYYDPREEPDFNAVFRRTRYFHPEIHAEVIAHLTDEERKDISGSYSKRLLCGDHAVALSAAKVLGRWAGTMSRLIPDDDGGEEPMTEAEEKKQVAKSRLEHHYLTHGMWLKEMQYMEPERLERMKSIPCRIVNGRYDLLCPPVTAWTLHKALPKSKLFIIADAGHSAWVRNMYCRASYVY